MSPDIETWWPQVSYGLTNIEVRRANLLICPNGCLGLCCALVELNVANCKVDLVSKCSEVHEQVVMNNQRWDRKSQTHHSG